MTTRRFACSLCIALLALYVFPMTAQAIEVITVPGGAINGTWYAGTGDDLGRKYQHLATGHHTGSRTG